MARFGKARHGGAMCGLARRGMAGRGKAWQGVAWQALTIAAGIVLYRVITGIIQELSKNLLNGLQRKIKRR